jgi:hypothetical protein
VQPAGVLYLLKGNRMKRVISASRRTDIPAFYMRWLVDRIADGYVDVVNPLFREKITHVSLLPSDVAWIVLWSKNYAVFQRWAGYLDAYDLFFHFTINTPSPFLEPDVPASERALSQVEFLAARYGGRRVTWRYDPIVCWQENGETSSNYDPDWFARMCREMAQFGVERCTTSFMTPYAKVRQRIGKLYPRVTLVDPAPDQKRAWAATLGGIADAHGITLTSCTDATLFDVLPQGSCIDGRLLNTLGTTRVSCAKAPGRETCGCTHSIDIGDYERQECGYACLYCYASPNHRRFAAERVRAADTLKPRRAAVPKPRRNLHEGSTRPGPQASCPPPFARPNGR